MTLNEQIARAKAFDEMQCRNWSGDIAAAWSLVEEMGQSFSGLRLGLSQAGAWESDVWVSNNEQTYYGHTAPEAICRAWLSWKSEEEDEL